MRRLSSKSKSAPTTPVATPRTALVPSADTMALLSRAFLPRRPMSDQQAALIIQRSWRGMEARRQANQKRGAAEMARSLARGMGGAMNSLVNDILLAPVNLASEALIDATIGKLLKTLVRGYDKKSMLKITSSGIDIGGKDGLYINDEALAALQGGVSPWSDLWLSSIHISLPVVLSVYPIRVDVRSLNVTVPPVPIVLSPERLKELETILNSNDSGKDAGKPAKASKNPSAEDLDAKIDKAARGDGGGSGGGGYGQIEKAVDGITVRIDRATIAMPQGYTQSSGGDADITTKAKGAKAHAHYRPLGADVASCALGCLVVGLRKPRWFGPKKPPVVPSAPPPQSVIIRLSGLEVVNANKHFVPSKRLAFEVTRAPKPASSSSGVGLSSFSLGRSFSKRSSTTTIDAEAAAEGVGGSAPPGHAASGSEVHVYKKLTALDFAMSVTTSHGVSLPVMQGWEFAGHIHLVRGQKTGKLLSLDVDLVLPDQAIGMLIDTAARTHGTLRFRTDRNPLAASAKSRVDSAASLAEAPRAWALSFFGTEHPAHSMLPADASAQDLEDWRRAADKALVTAASFDALDGHIRASLDKRPSELLRRRAAEAMRVAEAGGSEEAQVAALNKRSETTLQARAPDRLAFKAVQATAGQAGKQVAKVGAKVGGGVTKVGEQVTSRMASRDAHKLKNRRASLGLGLVPSDPETVGELLWLSPEVKSDRGLSSAEFSAFLQRYEVMLSEASFTMLKKKVDPDSSGVIYARRFLQLYTPELAELIEGGDDQQRV
mmetsp:Transcript_16175/g.49477  ORF Transcript_16175/g.49477 Transcript_16175/m.49477 type:complete len:775 (+) Transcript_16175:238-2562(+)